MLCRLCVRSQLWRLQQHLLSELSAVCVCVCAVLCVAIENSNCLICVTKQLNFYFTLSFACVCMEVHMYVWLHSHGRPEIDFRCLPLSFSCLFFFFFRQGLSWNRALADSTCLAGGQPSSDPPACVCFPMQELQMCTTCPTSCRCWGSASVVSALSAKPSPIPFYVILMDFKQFHTAHGCHI